MDRRDAMGIFGKKEPERVGIVGRALKCEMCGGAQFWRREVPLNTSVASFFNFDWALNAARVAA